MKADDWTATKEKQDQGPDASRWLVLGHFWLRCEQHLNDWDNMNGLGYLLRASKYWNERWKGSHDSSLAIKTQTRGRHSQRHGPKNTSNFTMSPRTVHEHKRYLKWSSQTNRTTTSYAVVLQWHKTLNMNSGVANPLNENSSKYKVDTVMWSKQHRCIPPYAYFYKKDGTVKRQPNFIKHVKDFAKF